METHFGAGAGQAMEVIATRDSLRDLKLAHSPV